MIIFLINSVSASYISGEISINEIGQARFDVETDLPINISGLNFQNSRITGKTDILIEKQAGIWTLTLDLENYDNILLDIKLPKNLETITTIEGKDNIIDIDNKIITIIDSGKLDFSVSYKLKETTNYSFVIWLAVFLIIVLVLILYFKHRKKKDFLTNIMPLINEQEQKIIGILMKSPMRQKQLREQLKIPKASFTRYIINLEKKKLITREGEGKNKIVKLK